MDNHGEHFLSFRANAHISRLMAPHGVHGATCFVLCTTGLIAKVFNDGDGKGEDQSENRPGKGEDQSENRPGKGEDQSENRPNRSSRKAAAAPPG